MDTAALVISVVNLLLLVLGGLFLRNYLPSYFTEKGKNLASKEDLGQLTELVESVRAQYTADLERLKAALVSEGQAVERRRQVYEAVCSALRIFISGHGDTPEAKESFHSSYAAAWLWASDPVLAALNRFVDLQRRVAAGNQIDQTTLKSAYADVVVAMRRDTGFPDTGADGSEYQFVQFV